MGRMKEDGEEEETEDEEELSRRPPCGPRGQRVLAYCLLVRVCRHRQVADGVGGPKASSRQHAFSPERYSKGTRK